VTPTTHRGQKTRGHLERRRLRRQGNPLHVKDDMQTALVTMTHM
jgi:hypothetical protein